jgi:threonine synthase
VQPALLAPLCKAFYARLENVPEAEATTPSVAEGLAIAEPVRGRRLLQALRETDGICVTVEEGAIRAAQRELARHGFYAEPTSATVVAALPRVLEEAHREATIVVPLTGSGLKGSPTIGEG